MTIPAAAETAALSPVSAARKALAKKGRKLADIVRAVHSTNGQAAAIEIEVAPQAPLPEKPAVGDDVKRALAVVTDKVNAMRVPTERRKLSDAQQQSAGAALAEIRVIQNWIEDLRKKTIRPMFLHHFAGVAEAAGKIDETTARDKDGFFILPGTIKLESGSEVKAEPRSGSVTLTADDLFDLVLAGKITKAQYNGWTRQVRVTDEDAILSSLERDPSLAEILKMASKVGTGSVAITVR